MKAIKFVVFDYNGTLTNDAIIGYKACNHMLQFYGAPKISFQKFKETFTTPWIDFYVANGVPKEKICIPIHQKEYQKVHTLFAKKELALNAGVAETLDFLKIKKLSLGVLSSRNISDLTKELTKLKILPLFDAIVGEEHINEDGIRAEKQTQQLITKLGISDPCEVLYVGDMVPDIKIAEQYGFKSGVVTTGWQTKEKLLAESPDYLFERFYEIKDLFK